MVAWEILPVLHFVVLLLFGNEPRYAYKMFSALRKFTKPSQMVMMFTSHFKILSTELSMVLSEGLQSYSWTREVFTAMTNHCDKPEVLYAACHALQELIDLCPAVLDEVGDEPDDSTIPLHRCCMAALMLHRDDPELCQSSCRVLASIVNNSSSLREVIRESLYKVFAILHSLTGRRLDGVQAIHLSLVDCQGRLKELR